MASKSGSKGQEGRAALYQSTKRWEANRRRKLERALKRNSGNAEQINAALKSMVYRRHTPVTPTWSSSKRRIAILFKLFTGTVNPDMFSNNEKLAGPALMTHSKVKLPKPTGRTDSMFQLGTRANDGRGNLVWA